MLNKQWSAWLPRDVIPIELKHLFRVDFIKID